MSARPFSTRTSYSVLLSLVVGAFAGCERAPSQAEPGLDGNVTARASPAGGATLRLSSSAVSQAPAATSQSAWELHDWVRQPLVDEAERDAAALRIVSAAPNVTEVCCALGLRSLLVGRTRYCDYPPEIGNVPSIGALIDLNVEALLELRPGLILVSGTSRSQLDRFAALDLRFESVPDAGLSDLFAAIRRVGKLTERSRTAERLCGGIEADLAAVTGRFASLPPARVLLLIGTLSEPPRPPYVAGPGSFYDDLLKRAGHENVVAGQRAAFAPLSLEFIVRADPEVIVELDADGHARPGGDADARRAWAGVGALSAVISGRVHVLTGNQHFLLGPRVAITYAALCRAIADGNHE